MNNINYKLKQIIMVVTLSGEKIDSLQNSAMKNQKRIYYIVYIAKKNSI